MGKVPLHLYIYTGNGELISAHFTVPSGFKPQNVTLRVNDQKKKLFIGAVNLGIDAAWSEHMPDTLSVTVSNTGIGSSSGTLKVMKGGKSVFSQNVTVGQGGSTKLSIPLSQLCTSAYELTVTLTESTSTSYGYNNEETVRIVPVTAQKLFVPSVYVAPGQQMDVRVQAVPSGAILPKLYYRVENTAVASVDTDGTVKGIKAGQTKLIVTTQDGESFESEIVVADLSAPSKPSTPSNPSDPSTPTNPSDPSKPSTPSEPTMKNPFVDVISGKYYYNAVLWAVENDITKGMDDTHFAPDNKCNRAQVVTFLWRAAGAPEPASTQNPFVDVIEGKYYYKAVLWAVENEITKGIDATHFGTNNECTRGHVTTFLWRTMKKPSTSGIANPFTDVVSGKFYYDSVLWAVQSGVTKGIDTTHFAPNQSCTRGQIVTFLHRALG